MAEEVKDPLAPEPPKMSGKSFITLAPWVVPGPSPALVQAGTYVGEGTPYPVPESQEPKEGNPSVLKEAPLPEDYGKPKEEVPQDQAAKATQAASPGTAPPEGKPFSSDDKTYERPGTSQRPRR